MRFQNAALLVADECVRLQRQLKRAKLRWHASRGARRSLGWVPFKASAIRYKAGPAHLAGVPLSLRDSYGLADYELGSCSVSEDARGRWYLNVGVKEKMRTLERPVAALGLKEVLATNEGELVDAKRFCRGLEPQLAVAQRVGSRRNFGKHAENALTQAASRGSRYTKW